MLTPKHQNPSILNLVGVELDDFWCGIVWCPDVIMFVFKKSLENEIFQKVSTLFTKTDKRIYIFCLIT